MEVKYWSKGTSPLENVHIVKLPYGEVARMLCGIRTVADKGVFTDEPSVPRHVCMVCARRLKAQRKKVQVQKSEDLRKLRMWQPSHPYLEGDQP